MFFKKFPKILFEIGETRSWVTDIFRNVDLNDKLSKSVTIYDHQDILDGERPDVLSKRLYGKADFYWTFFVTNDRLKNGLHSWPLSTSEFEFEMSRKYDDKSYFMIKPTVTTGYSVPYPSPRIEGAPFVVNNPGSIDLAFTPLYALCGGATAKIESWNAQLSLLVLKDFSDRGEFLTNAEISPITFKLETGFTHNEEFTQWMKTLCEWRSQSLCTFDQENNTLPIAVYQDIIRTTPLDRLPSTLFAFYFEYFVLNDLLAFTPSKIFKDGRSAPHHYIDEFKEETTGPQPLYVTNYDYERELNDQNSRIKVISPKYVHEFSDEYKDLINDK